MAERRIRQADLDAQGAELKLYVNQELDRRLWLLAKILAAPLLGATIELFKLGREILERIPQ